MVRFSFIAALARPSIFVILSSLPILGALHASEHEEVEEQIEEVIVLAESDVTSLDLRAGLGSISSLETDVIDRTRPNHAHELFVRIPGAWVTKNSGQEHLTGLRSAVLAGPGACGAVLLLENNLPVRPAGFCNVNGLFELNFEQAAKVEVLRGPASPLFGANAMYGAINVIPFAANTEAGGSLEIGPSDYVQGRLKRHVGSLMLQAVSTSTNGYRESTGHEQHKINAASRTNYRGWNAEHVLSVTMLDQETGGYVRGHNAYRDEVLRTSNPNPNAYREANSIRASSHWFKQLAEGELYLAPYLRRSNMTFLQHFLPGQPTEENDQTSAGLVIIGSWNFSNAHLSVGSQLEGMNASLYQHQDAPTTGSNFLQETRPRGTHYRYEVRSNSIAGFLNARIELTDDTWLNPSFRVERLTYDYDNLHLDGNTRDDGSNCGFGGCLYTRPADRDDTFNNFASRVVLERNLDEGAVAWGIASWGYRPPQSTELYRLQSGQTVADLASESLRSLELGIRSFTENLRVDSSIFAQRNENVIFRDAEGMNVSDGATQGFGVELELQWTIESVGKLNLAGTIAKHEYVFTREASRGESIVSGNEIDSAPRAIASVQWLRSWDEHSEFELELTRVGAHSINAANTARYGGHTLTNLRASHHLGETWKAIWRVMNIFDVRYADRADFAFGSYRYFPGQSRRIYVGIQYSPSRDL